MQKDAHFSQDVQMRRGRRLHLTVYSAHHQKVATSVQDKWATKREYLSGVELLNISPSWCKRGSTSILMCGGRYGLGSKEFCPRMVDAIFANLRLPKPKRRFTVGITDDVSNLSLPLGRTLNTLPKDVMQCVFWGFGSDGTVIGNKTSIKMIGNYHEKTDVQGYFEYDAKKAGGLTISYLRFSSDTAIEAPYKIPEGSADFVACHNESYVQAHKYHVTKFLKKGGTFLLNTVVAGREYASEAELHQALSDTVAAKLLRDIAVNDIHFYIMDASGLAEKFGLNGKINMLCVEAILKLSRVIPFEKAVEILKNDVRKTFAHKGEVVIQKNFQIIDALAQDPAVIRKVDVPSAWLGERKKAGELVAGELAAGMKDYVQYFQ